MEQNPIPTNPVPPAGGNSGNSYEQIPPQAPYSSYPNYPEQKKGFSITALVLGIVSIVGLCCCIGMFTAPFAVLFGIIALAKKQGGKGMAITGIVLGGLTLLMVIATVVSMAPLLRNIGQISQDMTKLMEDQDTVFPAYEQDQTLPDYLNKYKEPPYSDVLSEYDISIYDIMDSLLTQYKTGSLPHATAGTVSVPGAAAPALALPVPAG